MFSQRDMASGHGESLLVFNHGGVVPTWLGKLSLSEEAEEEIRDQRSRQWSAIKNAVRSEWDGKVSSQRAGALDPRSTHLSSTAGGAVALDRPTSWIHY